MTKYRCDYLSDGQRRSVKIVAGSAEEAHAKMRALHWAPGSGPIGSPKRLQPTFSTYALLLGAVAASFGVGLMRSTDTQAQQQSQSEYATRG